jgi:hypothetical protein
MVRWAPRVEDRVRIGPGPGSSPLRADGDSGVRYDQLTDPVTTAYLMGLHAYTARRYRIETISIPQEMRSGKASGSTPKSPRSHPRGSPLVVLVKGLQYRASRYRNKIVNNWECCEGAVTRLRNWTIVYT